MMATKTHNLSIKTGEYKDRDGKTKGRYLNVGSIFQHKDGGMSIKLDCIPVGLANWEGWVNAWPIDNKPKHPEQPPPTDFDNDFPY